MNQQNDRPASPQQRMTAREFFERQWKERGASAGPRNAFDFAEAFAARDRRELEESNEAVTALVERYLKRIFHLEVNLKMGEARAEAAESRLRELEEQVAQFEKDVEGETFQAEIGCTPVCEAVDVTFVKARLAALREKYGREGQ